MTVPLNLDLTSWIFVLFGTGIVLLIAEALLPTHGLLGVAGIASILGAIGMCFAISPVVGLIVFVAVLVAAPFVGTAMVKLWPRTPVGRRLILKNTPSVIAPTTISVGQRGVAISELRPIGICDFGKERVEVISEHGMIEAGTQVVVAAIMDNRPTVRPA